VQNLVYPVILGSDFLGKAGLIMDICEGFAYFKFDSANKLPMSHRRVHLNALRICTSAEIGPDLLHLTSPLSESLSHVIDQFGDVLTTKLGLTTV
jgi:hypothetical protein